MIKLLYLTPVLTVLRIKCYLTQARASVKHISLVGIIINSLTTTAHAEPPSPEVVLQNVTNISFHAAALSADGRRLATIEKRQLMLWDVTSGLMIKSLPLFASTISGNGSDESCEDWRITFLEKDAKLAIGAACGKSGYSPVRVEQVINIETNQKIDISTSIVSGRSAYSPDGELSLHAGEIDRKRKVYLSRISDGKILKVLPNIDPHIAEIGFIDASTAFLTRYKGAPRQIFDLKDGKELFANTYREKVDFYGPKHADFPLPSPDRKYIIYQKNGHLFLCTPEHELGELLTQNNIESLRVKNIRFIEGANQIEARGINTQSQRSFVATIDIPSLKTLSFTSSDKAMPKLDGSVSLREGRWELLAPLKGGLELWDVDRAELLRTFGVSINFFTNMTWSPDSKLLALKKHTLGGYLNGKQQPDLLSIQIWDMSTGRLKHNVHFQAHDDINTISFSPDSNQLFWTIGHNAFVKANSGMSTFDLKTERFGNLFANKAIGRFTLSPDGKWLVAQNLTLPNGEPLLSYSAETINTMTVYEFSSGTEVARFQGDRFQFSKDSSQLILFTGTAGQDAVPVRVSDWKIGKPILSDSVSFTTEGYSINPEQTLLAQMILSNLNIYELGKKTKRVFHVAHQGRFTELPYFSPDGDFMLMNDPGNSNNIKTLYSAHIKGAKLETIKVLRSQYEPEGAQYIWSPDNFFLAEQRGETILLRNGKTGDPIVNLVALDQAESVAVLPSGEYLATKGAMRAVGFRVGMTPYTFDQFDLKFNRPDVVLKALGKAPQRMIDAARRAYEKRLVRAGFTEAMLATDFHLPEVSVKREGLPVSTSAPVVALNITAKDSQVSLDRLLVTVNDVPFDGRIAGIDLKAVNSKQVTKTVDIPILSGSNRIQVSVLNTQGVESYRETLEVRGDMPATAGKVYALTIGVSEYLNPEYNLRYAAKDAKDIAELFNKAPNNAGTTIIPVLDTKATRAGILDAKESLQSAGPNDQVVVFLAGHGMLDDKLDYYFATTDIDFDHPASSGLSYDDIEGLLDGVKARRKLLLMDTCNSGELDKGDIETTTLAQNEVPNSKIKIRAVGSRALKRKPDMLGQGNMSAFLSDLFADTRRGSGAVAISSAGGAEYALESDEWNNGVFTFALIEGLKTGAADKNKDGSVSASELRDLVQTRVQSLTQGKQTPTSRRENLTVDFMVY